MKKILLAAVAALAIVGCSQNEEIEKAGEKAEINFSSVVGKGTRATVVELPQLKDNGFKVSAYNTGVGTLGTGVLDKPLMENVLVSWSESEMKWAPSTTYYWPSTGNVQFFAFSSKNSITLAASATDKYPTIIDYAVPTAAASQEDLLVANATGTIAASTVNFTFTHALTQVNFSIKKKIADTYKYVVTKLSLTDIGSKATYNYENGWGTTDTSIAYDCLLASVEDDNSISANDNTTTVSLGTEPLMLLPQTLTTANIVIEYKILDAKGTEYYKTPEGGKIVSLADEVWSPNKKMRYTLALTNDATPISWGVTNVDGWTSEGNDETNTDKEPATPTTPDA